MGVHCRFVVRPLDGRQLGFWALRQKCLRALISVGDQRRNVQVFNHFLKSSFVGLVQVNGRSRMLPPRTQRLFPASTESNQNRVKDVSDDFFALGIVPEIGKSNTDPGSGRAPRLRQGTRSTRSEDLDDSRPNCSQPTHFLRPILIHRYGVAKGLVIATSITMVSFFALFQKSVRHSEIAFQG